MPVGHIEPHLHVYAERRTQRWEAPVSFDSGADTGPAARVCRAPGPAQIDEQGRRRSGQIVQRRELDSFACTSREPFAWRKLHKFERRRRLARLISEHASRTCFKRFGKARSNASAGLSFCAGQRSYELKCFSGCISVHSRKRIADDPFWHRSPRLRELWPRLGIAWNLEFRWFVFDEMLDCSTLYSSVLESVTSVKYSSSAR